MRFKTDICVFEIKSNRIVWFIDVDGLVPTLDSDSNDYGIELNAERVAPDEVEEVTQMKRILWQFYIWLKRVKRGENYLTLNNYF